MTVLDKGFNYRSKDSILLTALLRGSMLVPQRHFATEIEHFWKCLPYFLGLRPTICDFNCEIPK